jgi:hypothetical protein
MVWKKHTLHIDGQKINAVAPEIISVSRSTDIPAFYAQDFMNDLRRGWSEWINPFNSEKTYISYENLGAIVFWSKNPAPLFPYLEELDSYNFTYYFQFTLNDYVKEFFEPNVPPLEKRIATFVRLSEHVGKNRMVWRYDPIILGQGLTPEIIADRIAGIGKRIAAYTEKLVFSFVDIADYRKVRTTLEKLGIFIREPLPDEMHKIAEAIGDMTSKWGITAATCGEKEDFSTYGISKNKCVDDELLQRLLKPENKNLSEFFKRHTAPQLSLFGSAKPEIPRDRGQRSECRCIISKAFGRYDTCPHLCVYCYANSSATTVRQYQDLKNNMKSGLE